MITIDTSTEFGARVAKRLAEEEVVWLTTTGGQGQPEPRLVWFLWENDTVLIYSQRNQAKLRHIARQPQVALNFNSTFTGGDSIVLVGTAEIDPDAPPASDVHAYVDKYGESIRGIGMTPESFAAEYSVEIRVTPTKLRGH